MEFEYTLVHVHAHVLPYLDSYTNPLVEPLDNPPAVIGGLWMAKLEHPHHDPVYCGTHVTEARITDDPFQIRPLALSSYFGRRINVDRRTIIHRLFLDLKTR